MNKLHRILIGIQARSTSSRLPNKGMALIGGTTMTQHVIDRVRESVTYLERNSRVAMEIHVALVVPKGDPLAEEYKGKVLVFEGSEHDVLSRYKVAFDAVKPDFMVRITGDCPKIPGHVITPHVVRSVCGNLDYCSNVDERWRTEPDGWDCEVMSARAFQYILDNAVEKSDREHVTIYIRNHPPKWAKIGAFIGTEDRSKIKCSVDTAEDLERVRETHDNIEQKIMNARRAGYVVFRC
jgi:spore coat polysaccharide biosynthesis protein SpsF